MANHGQVAPAYLPRLLQGTTFPSPPPCRCTTAPQAAPQLPALRATAAARRCAWTLPRGGCAPVGGPAAVTCRTEGSRRGLLSLPVGHGISLSAEPVSADVCFENGGCKTQMGKQATSCSSGMFLARLDGMRLKVPLPCRCGLWRLVIYTHGATSNQGS